MTFDPLSVFFFWIIFTSAMRRLHTQLSKPGCCDKSPLSLIYGSVLQWCRGYSSGLCQRAFEILCGGKALLYTSSSKDEVVVAVSLYIIICSCNLYFFVIATEWQRFSPYVVTEHLVIDLVLRRGNSIAVQFTVEPLEGYESFLREEKLYFILLLL